MTMRNIPNNWWKALPLVKLNSWQPIKSHKLTKKCRKPKRKKSNKSKKQHQNLTLHKNNKKDKVKKSLSKEVRLVKNFQRRNSLSQCKTLKSLKKNIHKRIKKYLIFWIIIRRIINWSPNKTQVLNKDRVKKVRLKWRKIVVHLKIS